MSLINPVALAPQEVRAAALAAVASSPAPPNAEDAHFFGRVPYLPSFVSQNPFTDTAIQMGFEFLNGYYTVTGAEKRLQAVATSPRFQAQISFLDWLALETSIQARLTSGSDAYSALFLGSSLNAGFAAGPKLRLFKNRNFLASIALRAQLEFGASISPIEAGLSTITSATAAEASNSFLSSSQQWSFLPRLHLGFSPIRGWSLLGEWTALYNLPSKAIPSGRMSFNLGLQSVLSFKALLNWPLALQIGVSQFIVLGQPQSLSPLFNLTLMESFRQDFNFAMELTRLISPDPSTTLSISLVVHY